MPQYSHLQAINRVKNELATARKKREKLMEDSTTHAKLFGEDTSAIREYVGIRLHSNVTVTSKNIRQNSQSYQWVLLDFTFL